MGNRQFSRTLAIGDIRFKEIVKENKEVLMTCAHKTLASLESTPYYHSNWGHI